MREHPGLQRAQHVLDRAQVLRAYALGIAPDHLGRIADASIIEQRSVADRIPVQHRRNRCPGRMAGDERDGCHDRRSIAPIELHALQCRQRVLVRHRDPVEALAPITEIVSSVDAVEAEEARFRPGPLGSRGDRERAPSGPAEITDQRLPIAAHQGLVATLIVDPQPRKQRRVCEPTLAATDRGRGPGAASLEPRGRGCLLEIRERVAHGRGIRMPVERDATVRFDEHEQHVEVAQASEQAFRRHARERVIRRFVAKARLIGPCVRQRAPMNADRFACLGRRDDRCNSRRSGEVHATDGDRRRSRGC